MKVAIDISPLSSGHKVRGVGSYVSLIKNNIEKFDKGNSYIFFEGKNIPKEADIIHYPYFDPFIPTLPSKFEKRTIITVHDLTPLIFKKQFPAGIKGNLRWLIQRRNLKKAEIVIADSKKSKEDITKIAGIPNEKVKVVYLAVDIAFSKLNSQGMLRDVKKKFNLPDKFLLYVGDATWNKNLPVLIAAVKKTPHKLVIVGKVWEKKIGEIDNNPWNKDLLNVLKDIKDDSQFVNLGFVETEDLVKIYNMATVFIMPSIYEGFGLPVLEAMSCGCPVITTNGGSLPEVGSDDVHYIKGFDSDSIEAAINEVMHDNNIQEQLSKRGLERAREFTLEKMMKSLVEVYEKVNG